MELTVQRTVKDSIFRFFYQDKKELLALYNALNGSNYTNVDDLEIKTLENAVFMNVKNDVAFILGATLNLYEHQSTISPNLPLRDLFYISHTLQPMFLDKDIYSKRKLMIPTPKFVVFYNGAAEFPEKCILKLSDLFQVPTDAPELELTVTVYNINGNNNLALKEQCKSLGEYSAFVDMVREYSKQMPIQEASLKAVDDCIEQNILRDFFLKNKSEAIAMTIFEYDEELHMRTLKQESYEDGYDSGYESAVLQSITTLMQSLNCTSDEAMDTLNIPIGQRRKYKQLLKL